VMSVTNALTNVTPAGNNRPCSRRAASRLRRKRIVPRRNNSRG
jgi:hypothetical protein